MYKIQNQLVPEYLQEIFPVQTAGRTVHKLRNSDNLPIPHCRTEHFRLSFVQAVNGWNALPVNIRAKPTL